jgi:threonine synthase
LEQFPLGGLDKYKLSKMVDKAYSTFIEPNILPLLPVSNKTFIMEEYYGPTASFKDLALQLFPQIFETSIQNDSQKYLVLVATSGDTGSAVLDGFKNTHIPVIVLYPHGKVR